eukprot:scaffold13807_cov95-Isochrysis_galbana.AAC.2
MIKFTHHISFYKVDLENQPFDPNIVWRYTLKGFADLSLALAHDTPAGAKGLLLQAPEGRAAATTSGVSCRAGRASTAAW